MRSWGVALGLWRRERMSRKAVRWGCSAAAASGVGSASESGMEELDVTGRRSTRLQVCR